MNINGIDPQTVFDIVLQAEVKVVMIALAGSAALRIGTRMMLVTVVSIRREFLEVRESLRRLSKKQ